MKLVLMKMMRRTTNAFYEIRTVSTYRHKYMVDAANINDAYDALRGGNVDELSTLLSY